MKSICCVSSHVGISLLSLCATGAIAPLNAAPLNLSGIFSSESMQATVRERSDHWIAEADFIRPEMTCPDDLETLTQLLLRDLPSYANRVSARSRHAAPSVELFGHVLVAGKPEFTPLTLGPGPYTSTSEPTELDQLFFTTLERQYVANQERLIQYYHWLFLAKTDAGWWFGLMVSRISGYPENQPQSPPRDSSEGVIARAIRLWLRDCRAGAIAPLEESDASESESNSD